ncbi:hypothetical protein N7491_009311 [Penicillium cf. griseofulvum]|uniref:Uncharacterized protein n=1 Tax=Penicillium cf. griseofulvum TaxID=2972120 RepID=A0A9W9JP05_9EURO|nr:hypothetical protein N7472_005096 [Penicillium cf. griseofulvum]KAJ5424095.1 hypothetical protein N7491_009311 [Penicillium cf. griseofulvum]KAJ5442665.1 hypothetical protein N7445_005672 [Penicillium cf. griseofulvum]
MSNCEPARLWQQNFQKECRTFVKQAGALADYVRKHPDDDKHEHTGNICRGLVRLWSQIAYVKDTGIHMVAETPRCSLVREDRGYWFIRALADQTEFEDECDEIEARLDGLIAKVERHELENLWVAGVLESTALDIQGKFHI